MTVPTKQLELTNELSKVSVYKINLQQIVVCPYANCQLSEMKTAPFIIAKKVMKYLGINLTKEIKEMFCLYSENHKTLMTEIEDTQKV
jgi:hypothetical protein